MRYILKTEASGFQMYMLLTKTYKRKCETLRGLLHSEKSSTSLTLEQFFGIGYELLYAYEGKMTQNRLRNLFPEEFI